jgi:ABC-type dipeptide/oligopeptide/nickel transport system permease component
VPGTILTDCERSVGRTVVARIFQAVPALVGVTVIAFILLHISGDPTYTLLPPEASDEQRAAFRRAYGLDQPLPLQYANYLWHIVRGDLGTSFAYGEPAMQVVFRRYPNTLQLALIASALAVLIAIPAGVVAAMARGTVLDRLTMLVALLGQSIPTFWLGMLLVLIFAVGFRWLPASGQGGWANYVMPSATLAFWVVALLARLTRSEMLEVLGQDYMRTARAKGLRERVVVLQHGLRNASIPIATIVGLQFGGLMGGAVMTETIFAWPGLGTLILDSILKKDYPVVLAGILTVAVSFIAINLLLDLLYAYLDPRLRRGY